MQIQEIDDENSRFDLVTLKKANCGRIVPHCKLHGAMNKVSKDGLWRCLRSEPDQQKYKGIIFDCRAGCKEIR